MNEPWLKTGAEVLLASGVFAGEHATVLAIDDTNGSVRIEVSVFGRPVKVDLPVEQSEQIFIPFGDQSPTQACPRSEEQLQDLLSYSPNAASAYRTPWWGPGSLIGHATVYNANQGDSALVVAFYPFPAPAGKPIQYTVRRTVLEPPEWTRFEDLLAACGFWRLPYDDGRRFIRTAKVNFWELEGYCKGKHHRVKRKSLAKTCEIALACELLTRMVDRLMG